MTLVLVAGIFDTVYGWLRWTWGGTPFSSPASGYNIVSGPLPDVTLLAGIGMLWRRHNCHTVGCPFLVWRAHPDRPDEQLCRVHHPHGHGLMRRLLVPLGLATVRTATSPAVRGGS